MNAELGKANVWLVAALLIERFHDEASDVAIACTAALADLGDTELAALWTRVTQSIAELERATPGADECVN